MDIRKAGLDDIETLTELRLAYLRERAPGLSATAAKSIAERCRDFFRRRLPANGLVAMLGEADGQAVSTAFMVLSERPANPDCPDGRVGVIMNVYTHPAHRRRGHSTAVVSRIVDEARAMGISALDLLAAGAAALLYEKVGFEPAGYSAMRMRLRGKEAPRQSASTPLCGTGGMTDRFLAREKRRCGRS
ncbi:MAG: GNAT family N-acetyltransferase [Planctomycetota bacterium]|jgi:GNAT superfamily N-acetyltransferase|nr:GNAT family N-acetyltransferase [Planctomycetota bacterium]